MNAPRVGLVILNYNCVEVLDECIISALSQTYPLLTIIIVDNGSSDHSIELLEKYRDRAIILETGLNAGFRGFNLGIKKALELGCKYIMYEDSDTKADPELVARLVEFLEANPQVGIAGPVQHRMESGEIYFVGSMIDLRTCQSHPLKYQGISTLCDYVGNAMIRRELLEKITFDERFFSYYCDTDLAIRARKLGFQIYTVSGAKLFSYARYTSTKVIGLRGLLSIRNMLFLAAKHSPQNYKIVLCLTAIVETVKKVAYWTINGSFTEAVAVVLSLVSGISILFSMEEPTLVWKVELKLTRYKARIPRV